MPRKGNMKKERERERAGIRQLGKGSMKGWRFLLPLGRSLSKTSHLSEPISLCGVQKLPICFCVVCLFLREDPQLSLDSKKRFFFQITCLPS